MRNLVKLSILRHIVNLWTRYARKNLPVANSCILYIWTRYMQEFFREKPCKRQDIGKNMMEYKRKGLHNDKTGAGNNHFF